MEVRTRELEREKLFDLPLHDGALCRINCMPSRIITPSENQTIDVDLMTEWQGYLWGLRKVENSPSAPYQYIAIPVHRNI